MTAYEQSSSEGTRLNRELKQATANTHAIETRMTELQVRLDETPPFKLLTDTELAELDHPKQTDYIVKRNAWESDKTQRKDNLARVQKESEKADEADRNFIFARSQHMDSHPDEWPDYKEMLPTMEHILEIAPFMGGMRGTPEMLYHAAQGLTLHRQKIAQKAQEAKAAQETAATAAAQVGAIGTGSPPAPVGAQPQTPAEDSDEALNKRLLEKAPQKSIFKA